MQGKVKCEYERIMQELGNNVKMDQSYWFKYYDNNKGRFWGMLRQRIRRTRYTLEYGNELDDLMQSSIEKIIIAFEKEREIYFKYRNTLFSLAATNAINQHVRQLNLFKGVPAKGMPEIKEGEKINPAFSGDGERVMTTSTDYLAIDLKIDVSIALTKEENKIVVLLLQKYTREEIAKKMKVHINTVYNKIKSIKAKLEAAGLKECAY